MSAFSPPTIRIIDDKGALWMAVGNAFPKKSKFVWLDNTFFYFHIKVSSFFKKNVIFNQESGTNWFCNQTFAVPDKFIIHSLHLERVVNILLFNVVV